MLNGDRNSVLLLHRRGRWGREKVGVGVGTQLLRVGAQITRCTVFYKVGNKRELLSHKHLENICAGGTQWFPGGSRGLSQARQGRSGAPVNVHLRGE